VVDADAQRRSGLPAGFQHGKEVALDCLQVLSGLLLGIVGACPALAVDKEPRVDTHLIDMPGDLHGDARAVVVDIGGQGHRRAAALQESADLADGARILQGGRRHAHDLAAGAVQALDRVHARGHISCRLVDHRLNHDRVVAANDYAPDAHRARPPPWQSRGHAGVSIHAAHLSLPLESRGRRDSSRAAARIGEAFRRRSARRSGAWLPGAPGAAGAEGWIGQGAADDRGPLRGLPRMVIIAHRITAGQTARRPARLPPASVPRM
jgi:hypothetical protein